MQRLSKKHYNLCQKIVIQGLDFTMTFHQTKKQTYLQKFRLNVFQENVQFRQNEFTLPEIGKIAKEEIKNLLLTQLRAVFKANFKKITTCCLQKKCLSIWKLPSDNFSKHGQKNKIFLDI